MISDFRKADWSSQVRFVYRAALSFSKNVVFFMSDSTFWCLIFGKANFRMNRNGVRRFGRDVAKKPSNFILIVDL